jgi:hypothetical protein
MILSSSTLDPDELRRHTGWELKPQGACKGALCVPLTELERTDVAAFAERLGMPIVRDAEHDAAALGPASIGGRALVSAEVPDLVLHDLDGNDFALSTLRGTKVVLAAWASW